MKLYTEEQVEKILCTAIYVENPQIQSDKVHIEANKYLKQLTPIELPSDEEIEEYADNVMPYAEKIGGETYTAYRAIQLGAKWMRKILQEGNK